MSPNADRCYLDAPELDMLLSSTVDGSGLVVVGGQVVKVPAEGPVHDLVVQMARFLTQASRDDSEAVSVRCSLLASIIGTLADLHAGPETLPFLGSTS